MLSGRLLAASSMQLHGSRRVGQMARPILPASSATLLVSSSCSDRGMPRPPAAGQFAACTPLPSWLIPTASGAYSPSPLLLMRRKGKFSTPIPDQTRRLKRRDELREARIARAKYHRPPAEPTPEQARILYRRLLKKANSVLKLTDPSYFRRRARYEFEITARRTSGRVRGVMFEKGMWMVENNMGGLM